MANIMVMDRLQQDENNEKSQLAQDDKMAALVKLSNGVAHDFNNILGIILGYTELLKIRLADQPAFLKYVEKIHQAGERGAHLSKQLLAFSRGNLAKYQNYNINQLIENHIETLNQAVPLTLALCDEISTVKFDDQMFIEMLLNVCVNAHEAMEEGGIATISTANRSFGADVPYGLLPGDYACVSVIDTGCGIESSSLANIFDPFFTTKGEGRTGLGLSGVYGFAKACGGTVFVTSSPGQGCKVDIYLQAQAQIK